MILLLLNLTILVALLAIISLLLFSLVSGGPYSPSANWKIKELLKLIKKKKVKRAADIGSGDGRIVIALAREGIEAHGYEINPVLVLISRLWIKKLGLEKKAFIHCSNLWQVNFSDFDLVVAYLLPHIMGPLSKKLRKEMKPKSLIVTHLFKLANDKPVKESNQLYLYEV